MKTMASKFSEKLSLELAQLYQRAQANRDFATKALLGQLCCLGTRSGGFDKTQRVAALAILDPDPDVPASPSDITMEIIDITWDSGDRESALSILRDEINEQLNNWSDPVDTEWYDLTFLTERYFEYSEDYRNTNLQLYSVNYLNIAQDIPELTTTIEMLQHLEGATIDKTQKYLKWLLHYKPDLKMLIDTGADTLLQLACTLTESSHAAAASFLLSQGGDLRINYQNREGKTALHCFCSSISEYPRMDDGMLASRLSTLRQLLLYPDIDVDIRSLADGEDKRGQVASCYLVREWYSSPTYRVWIKPFLKCFVELHPQHNLSWEGMVLHGTDV
ncbi:hypothetical protein PG987_013883 [Apiospora arundinis]